MKTINCTQEIKVPDDVTAFVKGRRVTVKGKRGTLNRDFGHLQIDIRMTGKKTIKVEKWFSSRKELAAVNTVCSHIQNMFTGVQRVSSILLC